MSEKIKRSDIFEGDIFSQIKNDLEQLNKILEQHDEKLRSIAKVYKEEINNSQKASIKEIQKLNSLNEQASKKVAERTKQQKTMHVVQQEAVKLDKAVEKAEAQKIMAYSKQNKELQQLRAEKNKINKAIRDEIKQADRAANAYDRLNDEARDLKNESKRLGAELFDLERSGKNNTKEFKDLEKQYRETTAEASKLDGELKKIDKSLGDNQRNVGNYESAFDKLKGTITSGFGALGAAVGVGALVTGLFNVSKELSKAENTARQFFNTSQEGSKAIAQEASTLAKVYDKDVNEVLRTANVLSKEFGVSGEEALAMINTGFEKGADVSGEFLDNLSEYSTQLRLAGLSAEESISIITETQNRGVFSDKGIDAIKEATISLREMAPATQEAIEMIGMSADEIQRDIESGARTYFDVIQEISDKTSEYGEKSQEAGVILADVFRGAGEDAGKFIFELGDLNTSLDDLEDQNKGLEGAVQNLTRSWYDFVNGVEDGTGAMNVFSGVINFVADNLGAILTTIGRLVAGFVAYKTAMIALNVKNEIANEGLGKLVKNFFSFKNNADGATKSASGFGKSLKAIGWSALIGVVIELAVAFYDVASGAAEARRKAEELDNYKAKAAEDANKRISDNKKELDSEIAALERRQKIEEAAAKTDEERFEIQQRYRQERKKLLVDNMKDLRDEVREVGAKTVFYRESLNEINQLTEKINNTQDQTEMMGYYKERQRLTTELSKSLGVTSEAWFGLIEQEGTWIEVQSRLDALVQSNTDKLNIYRDEISGSANEVKNLSTEIAAETITRENNRDKINAQTKGLKGQNEELKKQYLTLKDIDDLLNEGDTLDEIESEEISQENELIEKRLNERLTKINDLERLKTLTEKEANEQRLLAEMDALNERKRILILYGEDVTDINKEISEKQLQIQKSLFPETEIEKEKARELIDIAKDTYDALLQEYQKYNQDKIDEFRREEEAAENQLKLYQDLADKGAIIDSQSIADEERRRRDAMSEQKRLRKQEERTKFISLALQNAVNQVEQGKSVAEALTSTVALQAAVKALFAGFTGFWKGTDNAPEGFAWVDEKGAEIHTDSKGNIKDFGSDGGARLKFLEQGDKIIPHEKSIQLLQGGNASKKLDTQSIANKANNEQIRLLKAQNALLKKSIESKLTAESVGNIIHITGEDRKGTMRRINTYRK